VLSVIGPVGSPLKLGEVFEPPGPVLPPAAE